jgi:hypothetical protein
MALILVLVKCSFFRIVETISLVNINKSGITTCITTLISSLSSKLLNSKLYYSKLLLFLLLSLLLLELGGEESED